MNKSEFPPHHHVLIAGPGRSGTSLLVRVLSACGLETHIEKRGDQAWFDTRSNAGLEDHLFVDDPPYVVKSPWSYQYMERFLQSGEVVVDHAIIPVRKLRDAAASRIIVENQHRAAQLAELSARSGGIWDHFATMPGGIVYSMEPLDQERILATGFARLVEVLIHHEVPVLLLDFPRFVTDRQYLFERLRPLLPADITADAFHQRVGPVVDPSKVRVEGELKRSTEKHACPAEPRPSLDELDRVALRRALLETIKERDTLQVERDRLVGERDISAQERGQAMAERAELVAARHDLIAERDQAIAERNALITERDALIAARDHLTAAEAARDALKTEVNDVYARLAEAEAERNYMQQSKSWRATAPLRTLRTILHRS
jgi:hypothetical protein